MQIRFPDSLLIFTQYSKIHVQTKGFYFAFELKTLVMSSFLCFAIDQFRYIKIHTWLPGLGKKTKEMYYSLLNLKMISFFYSPNPRSQV